jgi:hypothetical protein
MIVAWAVLVLAAAVLALGASPAVPRHSATLHYLAGVLGAVAAVLAILRLVD